MNNRPWILVRGLARGRGHWGDFPEIFKKHMKTEEVYFIDIPGNGELHQLVSPVEPELCADFFHEQANKLTKGPYNIIAISLGAMVCVEWAKKYPDDIDTLFMINTSSGQLSNFTQRLRPQNWLPLFKLIGNTSVIEQEKQILKITTNDFESVNRYAERNSDYSQKHPLDLSNLVRQLILAKKINFPDQLNCKTHLFVSDKDRLVSANCSDAIAKKLNCQITHHSWAGHDLTLDDPEWLAMQITQITQSEY